MADKINLTEKNNTINIKRSVTKSGAPIYNKDGDSLFCLYRDAKKETLLLSLHIKDYFRLISGTVYGGEKELSNVSKEEFNDILRLSRKVAAELNMSLLVDSDLEQRFNVQNFVIYNKKKFTPVIDTEIKKLNDLGKSVDILAHPTMFSNALNSFHYKNDVLIYHNDRVEILDDIKANIQVHEEDIKDFNLRRLLKLNISNNDYSNITVNAEDKIIELNYNDNKDNPLKVPEADKSCVFFINSNEVGDSDIDVLNRYIPLPSVENFRKILNEDKKKISLSFNTYRDLANILNKLNFRNNYSYKRLGDGFIDKLTTTLAEKHEKYIGFIDEFMELYKEFPESLNKINDYKNEVYENALERKHMFDKLYSDLAELKEEILKEVEKKKNERTSAISNDMNL